MDKYIRVAQNTWYENIEYRLNFVMWRVRVLLQLLTTYFLWFTLIPAGQSLFNYSQTQMLTYVLLSAVVMSIVFSSRSHSIGEEINNGDLSNFLIRPINYFFYHFWRDIGDKGLNILFSIVEITLLVAVFQPPLFFQTDIVFIGATVVMVITASILFFLMNVLMGMIAFWSPEVWAPRFIFNILLVFLSGTLFPLDILPKSLFNMFQLLPFTYMLYFPIKVYLGQLALSEILMGFVMSLLWIFLLVYFIRLVWSVGIKDYAATGR